MAGGHQDKDGESFVKEVFAIFVAVGVICLLLWLVAGRKIIFHSAGLVALLAAPFPYIHTQTMAEMLPRLYAQLQIWRATPQDVHFGTWLAVLNFAFAPYSYLAVFIIALMMVYGFLRRRKNVQRRLTPESLLQESTKVFTGNLPVLHLRDKIVANKIPEWRRQTQPVEFLQEARVDGKPVIVNNRLDHDRLRAYLLSGYTMQNAGGRQYKHFLGRQIVDMTNKRDINLVRGTYARRFSPVGRILFALFVAHAFGGERGRREYRAVADALNRTCVGHPKGMPDLNHPLALQLFEAYANNVSAHHLLAIHHWEYTALTQLLFQAKSTGKMGHWDFMWLKPTNRILFYVMNTVGRDVPHADAAVAFIMHKFERIASANGRTPIVFHEPSKTYVHSFFLDGVISAFDDEWTAWLNGEDSYSNLWDNPDEWKARSVMAEALDPVPIPKGVSPDGGPVTVKT